jgi:uncharacterized DUF497 family protein
LLRFDAIEVADHVLDKIEAKHGVELYEVEEACRSRMRHARRVRGRLVMVLGTTGGGRYLAVLLAEVSDGTWRLVSARDMVTHERRLYARHATKGR